ncbi:MAG TPA: hypothetical protein VKS98_03130 [Chthoniobacterales bacterium]|nr:hypothetical protein [Chthoniobacterales bacterium]
MNWIFVVLAIVFFVTWFIFRVVLGIPLGVLNLLWMYAILFLFLSAAQRLA